MDKPIPEGFPSTAQHDAALAQAMREAMRHYEAIGRDPEKNDVCIGTMLERTREILRAAQHPPLRSRQEVEEALQWAIDAADCSSHPFHKAYRNTLEELLAQHPTPRPQGEDWQKKAAEWLESKAVEQEANNQRWPDHAKAYGSWRDRPNVLRILAAQVLAHQPARQEPSDANVAELRAEVAAVKESLTTKLRLVRGERDRAMQACETIAGHRAKAEARAERLAEALRWRGIESLPNDDTMILAKTDDGRVMIYRGSILARNLHGPTPEHLKFPATKWMLIPGDDE